MEKGKDFLDQVFLVYRYNSIMVSAFGNGMLTLLPVFKLIRQIDLNCSHESSLSIADHQNHFIVSSPL